MRCNVDIETLMAKFIKEDLEVSTSAHTLPASLGEDLPHIHVVRTGGYTSDMVIETHNLDFDVYAEDAADAMEAAADLCGYIRVEGTFTAEIGDGSKLVVYASEVMTLPYHNPDPRHPNLARATFKAQILTRTRGN